MPKISLLISIPIILGLAVASFVQAQDTDSVTATVTFQNITVSVSDGTVEYGTLSASSTNSTLSGELNDQQTATNNGNTTVDLNIQGQNASGTDPNDWTLASTPGSDQYVHEFSTNDGSSWTALTTSYQSLASSVASSGTQTFDLQITTPTSSTDTTEKNADVTVQATAS